MADPRTLPLDGASRSWSSVRDVEHCPACLGSLPPDSRYACQVCGDGTPQGLPRPPLPVVAPPARSAAWWPNLPPKPVLVDELGGFDSGEYHDIEQPNFSTPASDTPTTWIPQLADPAHPTAAEPTPRDWEAGDVVVTMRQGTFTPTGSPLYPLSSLSEPFLPRHTRAADEPPAARPWWRRMWSRSVPMRGDESR